MNSEFDRSLFDENFHWGVATSAYQIEGGWKSDNRGSSIWDEFCQVKNKVFNNHNGNNSCDFYNRWKDDIALMRQLNIPNYRFSIAWPRVMPEGRGHVNQKGIDFYKELSDHCLEAGIQPWITLYHWDLPLELERRGGWTNRDILGWFTDYASQCVSALGDRVKHWMVLNEPLVFTGAGYFLGLHAPGKKGLANFLPAVHHAALCQAEGGRVIRDLCRDAKAGTTFSCSHIDAHSDGQRDTRAAQRVDALLNRLLIEPLLGMGYPMDILPAFSGIDEYIKDGDMERMAFDFDFIGIQNYTREIVKHSWFTPLINASIVDAEKRKADRTTMNWEVYPESIYKVLMKFAAYKNIPRIIVTENGAAFHDVVIEGRVHDAKREEYIRSHIGQVYRAKSEGVPVDGYFVWSFMDNFEWTEGYYPRFGLVYIDFESQERIVKDSGLWYASFLNGESRISTLEMNQISSSFQDGITTPGNENNIISSQ